MPDKLVPVAQILQMLETAPPRMVALAEGLTPEQLCTNPGPDEWSVVEVLAHLRACADVWGTAIARILAEDKPTIRALDPRTWISQTDYPDLAFAPSFRAYAAQRADLLTTLHALPQDDWLRTATAVGAGKPFVRTVQYYGDRLALHERPHLKQIARICKAMVM